MKAFQNKKELKNFLEKKVLEYNDPSFISKDPVSIPHRFSKKQDIEIAGLFASIFAWGNRSTIIQKSNELMRAMDDDPYNFIRNHKAADLKRLLEFKHRTFNATDLLYFICFLQSHYRISDTLETAFLPEQLGVNKIKQPSDVSYISEKRKNIKPGKNTYDGNEFIKNSLSSFYCRFFSLDNAPYRTQKHIATPEKNSACKRLNMYLRWMVRNDNCGVDFGIWKKISAADLICPVDLHVARVARGFGLIKRKQTDWETAMELTLALRDMDKNDPVKYDFALFGLGVMEKY
jgi:uncharacterized protein (TIGR02757 family)